MEILIGLLILGAIVWAVARANRVKQPEVAGSGHFMAGRAAEIDDLVATTGSRSTPRQSGSCDR